VTTIALFTSATILRRHIAEVATTAAAATEAATAAATAEAATAAAAAEAATATAAAAAAEAATAATVTIATAETTAATAAAVTTTVAIAAAVTTAVTIAAAVTTAATAAAVTTTVAIAAAETTAATAAAETTATTATAEATASAAAEATAASLFARLGFIQFQWTTTKLGVAIHQLLNGLTTFVVSHLDKSEAAGTSRLTVHNKVHALHFAEFRKKTRHLILGDTEGEIPHINTDHDSIRFCSRSPMQDKKRKAEGSVRGPGGLPSRP
jgi:hypothetical protein